MYFKFRLECVKILFGLGVSGMMNPRKRLTSAKVEVEVELGKIPVLDCLSMNGNLLKYVQVILTECLCSVESYV